MSGSGRVLPARFRLCGASVVDGTGAPARPADVIVDHGRITLAGPGTAAAGESVVDVGGLVIAPGFIDAHSHADLEPFLGDATVHAARILQGVTTEVVGNCGFSPFPVLDDRHAATEAVTFVFGEQPPLFDDLDQYAAAVEARGLASNLATLVGHGMLRAGAMGFANRAAQPAELERMTSALSTALSQGAFGFTTGLCYTPATYAPSDEVHALAAVAAAHGAIYATHIRNETDLLTQSIDEALDVGRASGVGVHVSHLKAAGTEQWGMSADVVRQLDHGRAQGLAVSGDVYPYHKASTGLHTLLPPWTAEHGVDRLVAVLHDPAWRRRVAADLDGGVPGWQNLGTAAGWDRVVIATSPNHAAWEGRSIADLREPADQHPVDAIARVLARNGGKVVVVIEAMDPADVEVFLRWDQIVIGSDGIAQPGKPHPRLTGTFPRALSRYRNVLGGLEHAVHRMTGRTASTFGLAARGMVATGMVADLVVFDPASIADRGTYDDPWRAPVGIHHVLLDGSAAVWHGELVDPAAGRVLRRAG